MLSCSQEHQCLNLRDSAGDMNSGFNSLEKFLKEIRHESL